MSKEITGQTNIRTTVIIPNYNGRKYLPDCLHALKQQTVSDFQVCVVDNGSTDGSKDLDPSDYPEFRLTVIPLKENIGFAGAVNEGIRKTESPYVILLNNDTAVKKNFIEKLVEAIDNKKDVFACQAKMISMKDPEKLDSAGDLFCALGWAFSLGRDRPVGTYCRDTKIFSACAGAAVYRRDLLEKLGLFDERHFCYLEDVDLSYRAALCGYSCRFAPEAVAEHAGSASSGSRHNAFKVRLSARNTIFLIYKNMPPVQILFNLPFLIAGQLIKLLYFTRKGLTREYIGGVREGFRLCASSGKEARAWSKAGKGQLLRLQGALLVNTVRRITG
ncbi:MAG: glycosyltransferase family 2 protein [Lachnospiraceae bacterium]|nr:glycosyltransferase family 2 protein [Lachnospiraceae bacterium]